VPVLYTKERFHAARAEEPAKYLLKLARRRARRLKLPFSITEADIIVPSHCPVFGTPLVFGDANDHQNSPSIDRFKPDLGYVPGNICVISYRANELKRNATVEELQRLIQWMVGLSPSNILQRREKIGHIFKPTYTHRGVKKQSAFFHIKYVNRGKTVRESTGSSDYEYAKGLLKLRTGGN
jgi:hypothetical protein